jgi:DNA-binding CsgD family transcriptional regulator
VYSESDRNTAMLEAIGQALGVGSRSRPANDPTLFLMDPDLVVRAARGEAILRLPWFERELFVGRQLPDVNEIPTRIRDLAVNSYLTALDGERCEYRFRSYGHGYEVAAVPIRHAAGRVHAVLAVAEPVCGYPPAAKAYKRTAERLERSAVAAVDRAARHRQANREEREARELAQAERARAGAERARAHALRLETGAASPAAEPLALTPRETDILALASHGRTASEIAEELVLSPGTVRTHLEKIYPKLGVSDKAAAVATALRHGLIE